MFSDCLTDSDIVKLLSVFYFFIFIYLFFLFKESSRVTELIVTPQNSISCNGINTDIFQFMANPRCYRKRITVSQLMSISFKEGPIKKQKIYYFSQFCEYSCRQNQTKANAKEQS